MLLSCIHGAPDRKSNPVSWGEWGGGFVTAPLVDGVCHGWVDGQAAGHRATRQPCGLRSRQITLETAASPASAGVISSPSTPNTQPARHHVISNTRGCHLVSACLSLPPTPPPQTEVTNLQKQSRWQRDDPATTHDKSDTVYCLGYCSLVRRIMWFHCHVNKVWSRQAFDYHKWRVTHLTPQHWKISGTGNKWWPVEKIEGIC